MSFIKVLGYFAKNKDYSGYADMKVYGEGHRIHHFPLSTSFPINVVPSLSNLGKPYFKAIHTALNSLNKDIQCVSDECVLSECPLAKAYLPIYMFYYIPDPRVDCVGVTINHTYRIADMFYCVAHPDERERMERILNGTDNPLYDFVHELRYNPNIATQLSTERREAKDNFLKKEEEGGGGNKRYKIDDE
jgi:hypothetical protein